MRFFVPEGIELFSENNVKVRIEIGKDYPNIYLTRREAECAYLSLNLVKTKSIASILGISPRTVEFYLTNAKEKLDCKTRIELILNLLKTDFVENYKKYSKAHCL